MSRIGVLLVVILGLGVALFALDREAVSRFMAGDPKPVAVHEVPATPPAPAERKETVETDLYSFDYVYPRQAAAIPALRNLLEEKITDSKARLEAEAKQSRKEAKASDYPFQPHYFDLGWAVSADLPDWLAMQAGIQTYGGGAHPNHDFDSLIWDRRASKAIAPLDLFTSPEALDKAVHRRYCAALDKERAERREQSLEEIRQDDMWVCPGVSDLVVVLKSSGGKGFDQIALLAAPYVAGPYVEGSYVTELPVDAAVLGAVKPGYRDAFVVSR